VYKSKYKTDYKSNYLQEKETGACGLVNPSNYCYMNTIIQSLFHTKEFSKFFLDNEYRKFLSHRSIGVADEFARLLKQNKMGIET